MVNFQSFTTFDSKFHSNHDFLYERNFFRVIWAENLAKSRKKFRALRIHQS